MSNPPEARDLEVVAVDSGGQGIKERRIVVAASARALSKDTGANVPDSGDGAYVAVYWGKKNTGGYSVKIRSARLEGDQVATRLALERPPEDAFVTQSLTYPYAVALLRDIDPGDLDFTFVDQRGRELEWPVRRAR